jgi:hypothetical protein
MCYAKVCNALAQARSNAEVRARHLQVRVRSYASRNQLAAYPGDRAASQELEWERRYLTVLGAANKRLYQFRLQTADNTFETGAVSANLSHGDALLMLFARWNCFSMRR